MTPFAYPTVAALVAAAVLGSTVQPARAADIPGSPYYGAPAYGPPGEVEVYPPAPPPARYGYVPAPQAYYPPPAVVVAPQPYYEQYYVPPRPVYVYPRYGAYPRYPVRAHGPYVARSYGYRDWGPGRRW
jgi:hypothetical protein